MGYVVIAIVFLLLIVKMKLQKREADQELIRAREELKGAHEKIEKLISKQEEAEKKIGRLTSEIRSLREEKIILEKKVDFYAHPEKYSSGLNLTEGNETEEKELDGEQTNALHYMITERCNMFITGKAGTGKSFLLEAFKQCTNETYLVVAPTGIAALNVGGATIHSTFGFANLEQIGIDDLSGRTIKLKAEKRLVVEKASTIVIDEISMVRVDTFDKIDKILRIIAKSDKPFGGKRMLVFGDLFQLPPIAKEEERKYLEERYGGLYFFFAEAYKKGDFRFFELTENHRQSEDSEFFEILKRIREGKTTSEDIAILNQHIVRSEKEYDVYTTLVPRKTEADQINKRRLELIQSPEFVYKAQITTGEEEKGKKAIDSSLPIVDELRLRKNALVMMVRNDENKRWVNGTLGIVESLSEDTIRVSIEGKTYQIHRASFEMQEAIYKDGKIQYQTILTVEQYPIVLAYAMTIHKSQGQTYGKVLCDIKGTFSSGQAYVALSRCTSLEGLRIASEISETSIFIDETVQRFYLGQREKASTTVL